MGRTPKIKDAQGHNQANSIAKLTKIKLGGIEQYILIRGKNRDNPMVLFLHGGPGLAHIPFIRQYQAKLEEEFVVVHWDQRGAGLSYSKEIEPETMNLEQFIGDAHHLIQALLKRFQQNKIYLAGHSWGSYLGMQLAQRYPHLLHAYIGMSQVVDVEQAGHITYAHIMELARQEKNAKALKALEAVGPPPHSDDKAFFAMRKWLKYYEGDKEISLNPIIFKGILKNSEYRLWDILKYLKGLTLSQQSITEDIYKSQFMQDNRLEIPLYFFAGQHDYITPLDLVKKYMDQVKAPQKTLIVFEKSAHCPHLQQVDKFAQEMVQVKEETFWGA